MSDTFRELSPEEMKLAAIQFMGQHLTGDLKVLESHLVNKNRTCQGMTLDPTQIVNSIGGGNPMATVVNAGMNLNTNQSPVYTEPAQPSNLTVTVTERRSEDESITFSKQILDVLERIDKKLDIAIEAFKK